MTDLTAAFGTNHGIGGNGSFNQGDDGYQVFMSSRLGMGSLYNDLSGNMNMAAMAAPPKPLDLSAYQSTELLTKFREFRSLVSDEKHTLKSLEDKLAEIQAERETVAAKITDFHGILLEDYATPLEQFEALQAAQKALFASQKPILEGRVERLQKAIREIRQKLEFDETNLAALRAFFTAGVKELIPEDRIRNNMCPICMEHDVDHVLVPCGHTLCGGCSDQVGTKCMTCRTTITKVNKIFFSI